MELSDGWKTLAVSFGAMALLAGLDFAGAICAKEWADRGRLMMFVIGLLAFAVLYVVYAHILQIAELATVTIGWVIMLQVGLLLLDRYHYGVDLPKGKFVAIAAILLLQVYLIAAPNGGKEQLPEIKPVTQRLPGVDAPHRDTDQVRQQPLPRRLGRPLGPKSI